MNLMRTAILVGSIGRVWAVTRRAKNIYQTISIMAYFKLMEDMENGRNNVYIRPEINYPPQPLQEVKTSNPMVRRKRLSTNIKTLNKIIYDN